MRFKLDLIGRRLKLWSMCFELRVCGSKPIVVIIAAAVAIVAVAVVVIADVVGVVVITTLFISVRRRHGEGRERKAVFARFCVFGFASIFNMIAIADITIVGGGGVGVGGRRRFARRERGIMDLTNLGFTLKVFGVGVDTIHLCEQGRKGGMVGKE